MPERGSVRTGLSAYEVVVYRQAVLSSSERYDKQRSLVEQYKYLRDEAIRNAHKAGESQTDLAKVTGLTRQRIQQICGKDEG